MVLRFDLRLTKMLFQLLLRKKLVLVYLIGVMICTSMLILEAMNIVNNQYHSLIDWLRDECVLLFLILIMLFQLYNTYRNCLFFISKEKGILIDIGLEKKRIDRYLWMIFFGCTVFVGVCSAVGIVIAFLMNK